MSASQRYLRVGALALPGARAWGRELAESLPAEVAATWAEVRLGRFVGIGLQLALVVLVAQQFQIENQAFFGKILPLAAGGFVVHHFLPMRLRLPFFVLVSVAGLGLVLGVRNAAWLVGLGLGLIGLCHVPVAFRLRLVLLGIVGAGLVVLRGGWTDRVGVPWSGAIWPLLGSMFMYRLIVYVYEVRHARGPLGAWRSVAYFFLLPNVVFPLFPVVDFATFRRTYYDTPDRYRIYQRGVSWLLFGIVYLLVYRLVYQHLVLGPEEVVTAADLGRYGVANYLVLLRVVGQFFLIGGTLHLFGFHLPTAYNRFYLASSFTDLWRRANSYWRDFMAKLFYNPIYFWLTKRKVSANVSIVVATAGVAVATWALHSWQWFWLRGAFLLSVPDVLFWVALGLLLMGSTMYDARRGRAKAVGQRGWTLGERLKVALKVVATFSTMAVLWTLWVSPTVADWLALWSGAVGVVTPESVGWLAGLLVGAVGLGLAAVYWASRETGRVPGLSAESPFYRGVALSAAALVGLYVVGNPLVDKRLDLNTQAALESLRTAGLNREDAAQLQRGYYENLVDVGGFNTQLWTLYQFHDAPARVWPFIEDTEAGRRTGDFLKLELQPSASIVFAGVPLHTNRWGMRDREYDLQKPPNTYRVALLGASHVMGSGVGDDQTFDNVLEDRLNAEAAGNTLPYPHYEILNFGVPSYTVLQQVITLEQKALQFSPDAIFYVAAARDPEFNARYLVDMNAQGVEVPFDYLRQLLQRAGIDRGMPLDAAVRRMKPFEAELTDWAYRRIAADSLAHGVRPVWIYLSTPSDVESPEVVDASVRMATDAGFTTVNAADVYQGYDLVSLQIARFDHHPNVVGHRVIADWLYQALRDRGIL